MAQPEQAKTKTRKMELLVLMFPGLYLSWNVETAEAVCMSTN